MWEFGVGGFRSSWCFLAVCGLLALRALPKKPGCVGSCLKALSVPLSCQGKPPWSGTNQQGTIYSRWETEPCVALGLGRVGWTALRAMARGVGEAAYALLEGWTLAR